MNVIVQIKHSFYALLFGLAILSISSFSGVSAYANTVNGVGFTHQLNFFNGTTMDYPLFQTAVDTIAAQNFSESWIRLNINDVDAFPRTDLTTYDIDCNPTAPVNCNPTNVQGYFDAFTYAQSKGVKVLAVATVPYWAKLYSAPINPWEVQYTESEYLSITQDFFTIAATTFGSVVDKWQIFNEANIHVYDTYVFQGTSLTYNNTYMNQLKKIIRTARNTIQNYDTDEVSTNAGGFPFNQSLYDTWEDFFWKLRRNIDAVGLDMYPDDNAAEITQISNRIQDMNAFINKPVMVTEIGMCADIIRFDENDQANYIPQYINEAKAGGASEIFIYQLVDNMDSAAPCENNFGIINEDETQKASFTPVMNALQ